MHVQKKILKKKRIKKRKNDEEDKKKPFYLYKIIIKHIKTAADLLKNHHNMPLRRILNEHLLVHSSHTLSRGLYTRKK